MDEQQKAPIAPATTSHSENNKRIAKNTLFLYFRSILILGVSLYTSREVLAQLGVSDYGIYNVVGGVIVLFSFIQNAMSSATSRFFTFDLGRGDFEQLNKTFSMSVIIHTLTALVILVLGETVGLWFLNTQLVIPADRMGAANVVYQFSVISACVGIMQVPYMVAVTAHERMKVFAYAGIADAGFKLAIAISLGFAPFDKLKFFPIMIFSCSMIMVTFYRIYCHRNFQETHFKWFWDKKVFWERMGFSGFELWGGVTAVLAIQGGIFLINRFYGILQNAAYGVSQQVVNNANQFTMNLLTATIPQITKSLAAGQIDYFHSLIIRAGKFSFMLSFMFMAPLALQIDFVMNIWLKTVPDYAGIFCQLSMVNILMHLGFWPIAHGLISSGNNKKFRTIDGLLTLLIFPFTYIGLHFSPIAYICAHIIANNFKVIYWMFALRKLTGFSIKKFIQQTVLKCFIIAIISISIPLYITLNMNGWLGFLVCLTTFFVLFGASTLFIGLDKSERKKVVEWITNHLPHPIHSLVGKYL